MIQPLALRTTSLPILILVPQSSNDFGLSV